MAKRLPLSTGTVKSKCFNFALDDDDFEDTPEDFIARIIAPKARSNLNCCVLSEQRMAERPRFPLAQLRASALTSRLMTTTSRSTPGDLYPMSDPEFLPLRRNARSEHCCFYGICTSFTAPLPPF